jgi:DNA-binding response OmpR family regulator
MSTPPIVIIAEPDPMISSVLRVEFTHWDFAVFLAASGQEADNYAAQTVAHLVVIDVRLQMDAYEACARIRRRQGYAVRPIVLTANDESPRVRAAAHKAGATVLLPKPYSVADLVRVVRPFVAADDPLFTYRAQASGMAEPKEWTRAPTLTWQSSGNSALARNGLLLPIVRGKGARIPLVRKP